MGLCVEIMDFMDIEDDLVSDPIKDFLSSKLHEIKAENTKIQGILQEFKENTEKVAERIQDNSQKIYVDFTCMKMVHDKYAIWFLIENKTDRNQGFHNHDKDAEKLNRQIVSLACERNATEDLTERPSKIISSVLRANSDSVDNPSRNITYIRNNMCYQRRQIQVRLAISTDDVVDILQTMNVKTIKDEEFFWPLTRYLDNCRLILKWNSSSPLLYICSMFHISDGEESRKQLECIDALKKKAHVVAVIERPEFSESLSIQISGMFFCNQQGEDLNVDIPNVSITSRDITDRKIVVPLHQLIESKIFDFASCLVCSNKINLIQKLSNPLTDNYSILEIDACLYRIDVNGNDGSRFFIAHKLSPAFDGSVLEMSSKENSNISKVVIHYRDNDSLLAFVHHLYQSISSLILLPEEYEIRLHSKSEEECETLLKRCIMKEINFAKELTKRKSTGKKEIKEFKLKLCDIEHETDKAFVQLRIAKEISLPEQMLSQGII